MRLIDVDNLKTRLRNIYKRRESDSRVREVRNEVKGIIDSLIDVIDEEPTVDPVKHAHWIFKPFPDDWVGQLYICSECNETSDSQSKYCPHCGAKMNEKLNDEDKEAIATLIASGVILLFCDYAGFVLEFIIKLVRK